MFYTENMPKVEANKATTEGRFKILVSQKEQLKSLENELNIPASVLVRMALDCFLPKLENNGYNKKGIKAGYLNGNY